jgi:putative oxidoreductase
MFPQLSRFQDLGLLLLRLVVGVIFGASGWGHVTRAEERSRSIEMSKGFTIVLGVVELAGGLGVMFGVLPQLSAIALIVVMLGAMEKKIFVWKIGFWGEKTYGWHYDLMLVVMNLVILFSDGGRWGLLSSFQHR